MNEDGWWKCDWLFAHIACIFWRKCIGIEWKSEVCVHGTVVTSQCSLWEVLSSTFLKMLINWTGLKIPSINNLHWNLLQEKKNLLTFHQILHWNQGLSHFLSFGPWWCRNIQKLVTRFYKFLFPLQHQIYFKINSWTQKFEIHWIILIKLLVLCKNTIIFISLRVTWVKMLLVVQIMIMIKLTCLKIGATKRLTKWLTIFSIMIIRIVNMKTT